MVILNEALRNEESILLLYNKLWIFRLARNDKIAALVADQD
jgi:hypothetical protein